MDGQTYYEWRGLLDTLANFCIHQMVKYYSNIQETRAVPEVTEQSKVVGYIFKDYL